MIKTIKSAIQGEIGAIQSESANIVSVFTKTIDSLKDVNTRINKAWYIRSDKMAVLAKEQEQLTLTKESNERMINKLTSIMQD